MAKMTMTVCDRCESPTEVHTFRATSATGGKVPKVELCLICADSITFREGVELARRPAPPATDPRRGRATLAELRSAHRQLLGVHQPHDFPEG